ncbi:MAG: hypothetical protein JXB13_15220 [Phycisphaerae bacterium]|nr:hypothetical protein [Phycisphaerae bacterium]
MALSRPIRYCLDEQGLRLEGVGPDNPIIYDNDWWFDVFDNNYLWAQASLGRADVRGNIVTRDMWDWQKGYHYKMRQCVDDAKKALALARDSGLRTIPEPTLGSEQVLERPPSGRIEDTLVHPTAGSRLIVAEARKASPAKPLLIIVGGALTTVANALLTDPDSAPNIVVFGLTVSYYGYNGKDGWSTYIVARKARLVEWATRSFWDKDSVFRAEHFEGLQDNPFTRDMKRFIKTDLGRANQLGDGAPLVWLYNHRCWRGAKMRRAVWRGPATDFIEIAEGETGDVLDIPKAQTDLEQCRKEFFRVLSDPGLFRPFARAEDRIRPFEKNPYYWQYKGKPVLLLGGSDDDNLFQWEQKRLAAQLDRLVACGGNYVRNTMSDRDEGNVYAFARVGDRYHLGVWNEEYWERLRSFLRLAAARDIIVQIELWDMWDLTRDNWVRHPFNPRNNLNYTAAESGLLTEVPFAPAEDPTKHNFFHTVPELENNTRVLRYQEAFIDRVLEISLPYPNVLYCINNESGEPPQWSRYWAQRIHQRAKERGITAQVTDMRRREDITHTTHRTVYDDTEVYTFADVSQNSGHQIRDRRLQYQRLLAARRYLSRAPRPINHVKIYNDHLGGAPKFLRNIFAGLASTRFHRPVPWNTGTRGLGLSEEAQRTLRSVRGFTGALDWFALEPRPDLLSHDNGVYLMADPGRQYTLGFDGGGSVELDGRVLRGPAQLRWMNVQEGTWIEGGRIDPGRISLKTPDDGLWMALILAGSDDSP